MKRTCGCTRTARKLAACKPRRNAERRITMVLFRSVASMGILLITLAFIGCDSVPSTDTQRDEIQLDAENGLVVPYDCIVYPSLAGGDAGATTELGFGTSESDFKPVISGLPSRPVPNSEISLGIYKKMLF